MPEIKCPNCGKMFQIDEASYNSISKQVKDTEFEKQLQTEVKLALSREKEKHNEEIKNKDAMITKLSGEVNSLKEFGKVRVKGLEEVHRTQLEKKDQEIELIKKETEIKIADAVKNKDQEIIRLKEENSRNKIVKEQEISKLKNEIQMSDSLNREKQEQMKKNYESQLRAKQEEVDFYKDFKAKQSTKMIGESLEVHCSVEFNKLRPLFPRAYFEKDNAVSRESGSKGDFIFRDFDEEGTEIVSIMFEMKNENDTTATKHKNEDFFKELDKDRKEKGCEYAVLVTMLEADNELYNAGIVDVSYRYPKMYVIRPQFFIPIITLIRNGAMNALSYKKELEIARNQDIDLTNFEQNMADFKSAFGRNYKLASDRFREAIEEIDKTIEHLEKTKRALMMSENNLRLANNKAQEDFTIKKLTKNAPSIAVKIKEASND